MIRDDIRYAFLGPDDGWAVITRADNYRAKRNFAGQPVGWSIDSVWPDIYQANLRAGQLMRMEER